MGVYSQYLEKLKGFPDITRERKAQLKRIAARRGSDVIVIAAAIGKPSNSIDHTDLIPIADQLDTLSGEKLDVILETPGGSGEATEDIVRLLRKRHKSVSYIIPGTAKSAGTIMAMSGDEILMGSIAAVGPIDAQVAKDGKFFSAEAFLEGLKKIKEETAPNSSSRNRAYIPILQGISPGEIEAARNALKFGRGLAASWLAAYKFKHWVTHSDGRPVTEEERKARAESIAADLGSHSKWLSHGRSIKMEDLRKMGIKVSDYEEDAELSDAIRRYHILLRMSFEINIYKLYETAESQIYRFQGAGAPQKMDAQFAHLMWRCPKCSANLKIQMNFNKAAPITDGAIAFPADDQLTCPKCGTAADLKNLRMQIEAQSKKKIV